jgi:hypothetical protein
MSKKEASTNVQQVDIDIDELLGTGVDSVMLADETGDDKKEKNSLFSPMEPDLTFLDKPEQEPANETKVDDKSDKADEKSEVKAEAEATTTETTTETNDDDFDPLSQPSDDLNLEDDEDAKSKKTGRPSSLVTATKKLFEKGVLTPFVNDKGEEEDVTNYTAEDFEELISSNLEHKYRNELPQQFLEALPDELQRAYQYVSEGGTDLKGMFRALSASTEIKELDPGKESHQKQIIRQYLSATKYGTPEEIEDELYALEDRGDLEKKANQFKPKLDKMQDEIVNQRVVRQQEETKRRQEASQMYIDSIYSTLEKGELNGVKLDNKTQNMLYQGLVQSNQPSMSGNGYTNLLGSLLEKYQWGTEKEGPRHDLIAEALWLLKDPEEYKNKLREGIEKETHEKTLRTLKTTEQTSKSASSYNEDNNDTSKRRTSRGIPKQKRNFFGRS